MNIGKILMTHIYVLQKTNSFKCPEISVKVYLWNKKSIYENGNEKNIRGEILSTKLCYIQIQKEKTNPYPGQKLLNTFVKNKAIQLRRAAMIIADQAPGSW